MLKGFIFALVLVQFCLPALAQETQRSDMDVANLQEQYRELFESYKRTQEERSAIETRLAKAEMEMAKIQSTVDFADKNLMKDQVESLQASLNNCNASLWRQRQILNQWDACYPSGGSEGIGVKTPCESQ